ncbi:flagellar basal body P-ring formation chaperone FlgA [Oceaniglobus indicus]|uniref:flagellar basal body P-ring formation chaperone FlgA n=1 Tax=Oceaniglobus indicus TaxID=2047749 RepID=UPI000C19F192|nr:flagellar basal body P-ring formation chaperone FlgA [Oceaniglobus indicus]
MIRFGIIIALTLGAPVAADTLVAARTIRAQAILGPEDLKMMSQDVLGALGDPAAALGLEARVMLYAGRPIRPGDIGPPALVERNQIVRVYFRNGPITIAIEGRVLTRAGSGDPVRVMNLESRTTVSGTVAQDGTVHVVNRLP